MIRYWNAHSDRDWQDGCGNVGDEEDAAWEEEMEHEIEMVPVQSSNISSAGYDDGSRTLRVEFSGGATYDYSGVSREYFEGLIGANSPGGYFFRNIRDVFRHTKVS